MKKTESPQAIPGGIELDQQKREAAFKEILDKKQDALKRIYDLQVEVEKYDEQVKEIFGLKDVVACYW